MKIHIIYSDIALMYHVSLKIDDRDVRPFGQLNS
jgi:hypothetical protein